MLYKTYLDWVNFRRKLTILWYPYCPISCYKMYYKILSKGLCNRLKHFLPYVIFENQRAFVYGRYIGDNILLAHELLRDVNKRGVDKLSIKVDLEKAYDKINRRFICYIMGEIGFPTHFVNVILGCINTPTFSILMQGVLKGFVESIRGLQQGDPLSPYLFTIAMVYFTYLMKKLQFFIFSNQYAV